MVSSNVNIAQLFESFQEQMKNKLTTNRVFIQHPGSKGEASETAWITWLSDYLPKRYSVGSAFIIDSNNNISEQIDIVIYDNQYSPFVFNQDGAKYIPAESVYAIFEVKQEMDKFNIEYAKKKAKSVRSLSRTSAPIKHAGGIHKPVNLNRIISGIITLTSKYNLQKSEAFSENLSECDPDKILEIGLTLDSGAFTYIENKLVVSKGEDGLLFFFLELLNLLQKQGTVPAMDLNAYMKHLR